MTQAERAKRLDALRYQIDVPRVSTMGACANRCGRPARGGGKCADCIIEGDPFLAAYAAKLRAEWNARHAP